MQTEEATIREKGKAILDAKTPAWARAAIIADLEENTSDLQSDYHGSRTVRTVILAWSKHERDLFPEMRKAAARFSDTAHLGPGKGRFFAQVELLTDIRANGCAYWSGSVSPWHREEAQEFDTREAAEAYIVQKGEPAPIYVGEEVARFRWEIREEEIEHREKYSMGHGYYLAHHRYSGWQVRKVGLAWARDTLEAAAGAGGYLVDGGEPCGALATSEPEPEAPSYGALPTSEPVEISEPAPVGASPEWTDTRYPERVARLTAGGIDSSRAAELGGCRWADLPEEARAAFEGKPAAEEPGEPEEVTWTVRPIGSEALDPIRARLVPGEPRTFGNVAFWLEDGALCYDLPVYQWDHRAIVRDLGLTRSDLQPEPAPEPAPADPVAVALEAARGMRDFLRGRGEDLRTIADRGGSLSEFERSELAHWEALRDALASLETPAEPDPEPPKRTEPEEEAREAAAPEEAPEEEPPAEPEEAPAPEDYGALPTSGPDAEDLPCGAAPTSEASALEPEPEDEREEADEEREEEDRRPYGLTATYSPEDNKLRLYSLTRLDPATYQRVKAAGFAWAPKQGLFVAPCWTPDREDLLTELCGEIGDEDTSLVDRAEERAERFDGYSDRREHEAESARRAVAAIADNIPLGQPILVGHHSEKRARKDAERIENGMRKAVKLWETSQYWERRAAGALRHAKYKERPDVRARRIKGLEADERKLEKNKEQALQHLRRWDLVDEPEKWKTREDGTKPSREDRARFIANLSSFPVARENADGSPRQAWEAWSAWDVLRPEGERYKACPACTVDEVLEAAKRHYPALVAGYERWLTHLGHRLAYERAMLAEAGGPVTERWAFAVGGQALAGGEWRTILRVNKSGADVTSLTLAGTYGGVYGVERVRDYRPPEGEAAEKVKAALKLAPLCNFPGEGFRSMTKEELGKRYHFIREVPATAEHGAYRIQHCLKGGPGLDCHNGVPVYLTDQKRKDPPPPAVEPAPDLPPNEPVPPAHVKLREPYQPNEFEAMREQLRTGVQVVSAPQLFPTPPELARRMVELAEIEPGHRVLEPSAGTGNLLAALPNIRPDGEVVAVEINPTLARALEEVADDTRCADFLQCNGDLGTFDRVLMNPPFENGADIRHIRHALGMLQPGGRLVALCANGPRQQAAFRDLAEHWEELPEGTFAGTGVRAALLVLTKEGAGDA